MIYCHIGGNWFRLIYSNCDSEVDEQSIKCNLLAYPPVQRMGLEANGPDCPLHQVRTSCEWVAERSEHVKLGKAITTFWESEGDSVKTLINPPEFDKSIHFVDGGPLTGVAIEAFAWSRSTEARRQRHLQLAVAASSRLYSTFPQTYKRLIFSYIVNCTHPLSPAAQYMLCVDALNFCFWPTKGLEYEHLSCGIKKAVERDPHAIDAERLASIDEEGIRQVANRHCPSAA